MIFEKIVKDFFLKLEEVKGVEREIKIEEIRKKAFGVVGPRKSGKTWLFIMLSSGNLYVDLQDIAFKKIEVEDFFKIIEIYTSLFGRSVEKVFIDEIQELRDWESLVLSLLNRGYKVYITGSSSKILKKEFSSMLRGKCIIKILLPFSFREFLRAKGFSESIETFEGRGKILKLINEYLIDGAYPEVVMNKEIKEFLWKSYLDEIFYKDFLERHKLRNLELAKTIFEYILQNFSNLISVNKLKRFLKGRVPLTDRTLYDYLQKLEDTLNVFFIRKYSERVYERMSWPRKVYIVDAGISNLILPSKDIGKRMENTVFLELLRMTNEDPLMEIFYFRDYQQREVDFIVKKGLNIYKLIQVTYASSFDEIEKRELRSLIKASELLKCKDLLVITWNYEDEIEYKGNKIKMIPLWRWLLTNF